MSKSKIFALICLSFLSGVGLASFVKVAQLTQLGILAVGISLIFFSARTGKRKQLSLIGFCLLFFIFGAYWLEKSSQFNNHPLKASAGIFSGKVYREPEIKGTKTNLFVRASDKKQPFNILVVANRYPEYQYGDLLEINGRLEIPKNYGEFDYRAYLAKDDIYFVAYYPEIKLLSREDHFSGWLYKLRKAFEQKINLLLPEPQASFLSGLILGQKKSLPTDLSEKLRLTGTTHLVALSGYNITIIAMALFLLFNFLMLARGLSFSLSIIGIILFTIMTGAAPSVVRAAVMGILILIAKNEGRVYNPTNALILAGTAMVFLNPKIMRFDIGFQLSFLATCGLFYLSPLISEKLKSTSGFFRESLATTLGAQIFVLPLLAQSFGLISTVSLVANILILPLIPLTMFLGFLSGILAFVFMPVAQLVGWLAWLFLSLQIQIINFLANPPWAVIELQWYTSFSLIYYFILCLFIYLIGKTRHFQSINTNGQI